MEINLTPKSDFTPKNVKDVRRLIGMAGWYRRFIRDFSVISAPMTNLIKKAKQKFIWTEGAQIAFDQLKNALTSAPILGVYLISIYHFKTKVMPPISE